MALNLKEACEQLKHGVDMFDMVGGLGINLVDVNSTTKKINCPFHDEKDPSLYIENKNGCFVWHCFGCKKGGSAIDFCMNYYGVNIVEAIKRLDPNIELVMGVGELSNLRLDLVDQMRVEELCEKETEEKYERLFFRIASHAGDIIELDSDKETVNSIRVRYVIPAEEAADKQEEGILKDIEKMVLEELGKRMSDE